ncbi:hypothetical protein J6590_029876 [Homalodisca vitripennis]|nr:hypothetical protein J6590_029876 [Homalodisca vitripennis]
MRSFRSRTKLSKDSTMRTNGTVTKNTITIHTEKEMSVEWKEIPVSGASSAYVASLLAREYAGYI